ncbi:hypothetical protein F5Y19DRAFT_487713 [Xylariaceae sp. FL1651]|nr:hypothetical protein F5Y19DRAFT_487713 [Xylariaceae sp. FL1651]
MSSTDKNKNKASRGCWTCKDRKVRCDRILPSCLNCARLQQTCQGYGVRLSWPRHGDTKRSIIGRIPESRANRIKDSEFRLVHTSYFDFEMYHYLAELGASRVCNKAIIYPDKLRYLVDLAWKPFRLNAEELELLRYFDTIAYSSLATFRVKAVVLRDILVRMALSSPTIPSRAILHALLAVSSLHRDGLQLQAARHKTAAVSALAASVKSGINGTTEAAQHVAAGMLLCSFEIHMGTESHGHWPWYLMGARDIIKATGLDTHIDRNEIGELILWTYYHDVLARFSLIHWRRSSVERSFAKELGSEGWWQRDLCKAAMKLNLKLDPIATVLRLLGDVIDTLWEYQHSETSAEDLQTGLQDLELKLSNIPESPIVPSSTAENAGTSMATLTELYRMAVLIYLARVAESKFGEPRDLGPQLDRAFAQLEHVHTCERLFPIFILGCEAQTDERRMAIFDILRRTEEQTHVRSLECMLRGLTSVWIQDDLNADQDLMLDYINKMNVVISASATLPTFV